jgi:hypothetical protein
MSQFWDALGDKGDVKSEEEGGNDIVVENEVKAKFALYK